MSEIKVGDRVFAVVCRLWEAGNVEICLPWTIAGWTVRESDLVKIPPPDPHAELKAAVVDTAVAKYVVMTGPGIRDDQLLNKVCAEHDAAVLTLLAAQRPPDLVAELRGAIDVAAAVLQAARFEVLATKLRDKMTALETERDRRNGNA